jgi:molybdopterin-guanine dinucleotide biosynthesis protein A
MNLTAIILAGGQSLRMGLDKTLIPYLGKPLIQYSIDLALCFTKNIIISANQDELRSLRFPVVTDIYPVKAPLAGIHAGLKFSKTNWNLVLTCDMPNVSTHLINLLISKLEKETELVLPGHHGYIEPLCGFYNKSLITVIESNIGKNKLSPLDLLKVSPHNIVQMEGVFDENISSVFKNVNSRNDLSY